VCPKISISNWGDEEEEMSIARFIFAAACFLLLLALPNDAKAQRHSRFDESAIVSDLKYGRMSYNKFVVLHKDAYCNDKIWIPEDGMDIDLQRHPNQSPSYLKKRDSFTCCLDDFGTVLGGARFKVLRNNVCGVYYSFSSQRLSGVYYTLKAQSVGLLMPDFIQKIGNIFDSDDCGDRTPEVCRAIWIFGPGYVVELKTNVPYGEGAHDGIAIEARPEDKNVDVRIALQFS
jgi:hypothetical protein